MDAQEEAESRPRRQHEQGAASALLQQDVATFLQEFNMFAEELQDRVGASLVVLSEGFLHPVPATVGLVHRRAISTYGHKRELIIH